MERLNAATRAYKNPSRGRDRWTAVQPRGRELNFVLAGLINATGLRQAKSKRADHIGGIPSSAIADLCSSCCCVSFAPMDYVFVVTL